MSSMNRDSAFPLIGPSFGPVHSGPGVVLVVVGLMLLVLLLVGNWEHFVTLLPGREPVHLPPPLLGPLKHLPPCSSAFVELQHGWALWSERG